MVRLARCRSAMALEFEAGRNFPPAAQSTTYRATRLAELPDSPACLFPVRRRRAFAADNPPPLEEASCCWPGPIVVDPSADGIRQFLSPAGIGNQPAFATLSQKTAFYQH